MLIEILKIHLQTNVTKDKARGIKYTSKNAKT